MINNSSKSAKITKSITLDNDIEFQSKDYHWQSVVRPQVCFASAPATGKVFSGDALLKIHSSET